MVSCRSSRFGVLAVACILSSAPAFGQNCYHRVVVDIEPNNAGPGEVIRLGNEVVDPISRIGVAQGIGTMSSNGDVDFSQINLNAGDRLLVLTIPLRALPNNFDTPDTIVEILNPAGVVLAASDDGGTDLPSLNSRGSTVRLLAPVAATYRIRVSLFPGSGLGRYAIVVARTTNEQTGDWAECGNDTVGTADFLHPHLSGPSAGLCDFFAVGDDDWRTMPLARGDVFYVSTMPSSANFHLADTVVDLIAPNGVTVLASDDDDDSGGDNTPTANRGSTIRFRVPANGTYFTRTSPFDGDSVDREYFYISGVIPAALIDSCEGDADNDGDVDFADVTSVLQHFLEVCQ